MPVKTLLLSLYVVLVKIFCNHHISFDVLAVWKAFGPSDDISRKDTCC